HGKDSGRFVFDMIYFMRDLLFFQTNSELKTYLERAIATEEFEELANKVEAKWIEGAIVQLTECEQQLKWTTSPKVFVEVTLIAITNRHAEQEEGATANVANMQEVVQLQQRLAQLEKQITALANTPQGSQTQQQTQTRPARATSRKRTYDIPFERIRNVLSEAKKAPLEQMRNHWGAFLEQLRQINMPAYAIVQDSKPVAASTSALIV